MADYIPRQFTCPQAVTHPSSNRATTLIEANTLTTTLHHHLYVHTRMYHCQQSV